MALAFALALELVALWLELALELALALWLALALALVGGTGGGGGAGTGTGAGSPGGERRLQQPKSNTKTTRRHGGIMISLGRLSGESGGDSCHPIRFQIELK